MREFTIILGGQEFNLRELPARQNSAWRKQLDAPFKALLEAVRAADTEINSTADIPVVLNQLQELLIANADQVPDIVISYSPALEVARRFIDENATETEFLNAFMQIARVAYPTDFFIQQVAAMKALGSQRPPTMTSLPLASGGSGATS
ncbi:MAG: hypothetical protein E6Q97_15975 [Desulfurellales bacterium]|nr:MAG: hypothetical protein E6Q97_15975 [Desulfurellales bacterium]